MHERDSPMDVKYMPGDVTEYNPIKKGDKAMKEIKMCPMQKVACLEKKCAWYERHEHMCAIPALVTTINRITTVLYEAIPYAGKGK